VSTNRRQFIQKSFAAAAAAASISQSKASVSRNLGLPGPYPGRVIAVEHPGAIVANAYQKQTIQQMMQRGMTELTQAPSWQDAWRTFFEKGDIVGIKVSPVGGPNLSSDASVLRSIIDGLNVAGVTNSNIVVFNRYDEEARVAGIDKWLPDGVHFTAASRRYTETQLDMEGYDENHFMEMALIKPGDSPTDPHVRRSYVAKVVSQQVNKIVNLPVLKHHQSAGVTITLKNMSHGCVNNVNRSHLTPTNNACGIFIPSVVSLPVFREKFVLHVVDAVKASYHGGPPGKARFMWEPKTLFFGTDPVALDKTGLKVGMSSVALSKPDNESHYLNAQVEHIEIAGMLQLGMFADDKIHVKRINMA
jgi:hypothetical protein